MNQAAQQDNSQSGRLTRRDVLDYEVFSSLWPAWIPWPWLQKLASRYFAWKVNRKLARFEFMMAVAERLKQERLAEFKRTMLDQPKS